VKKQLVLVFSLLAAPLLRAQLAEVPQKLNHQGRVTVSGVNFHGTGQFKFALIDELNTNQTARAFSMAGGSVISIFVNHPGTGYVMPPLVTIAPPETPGVTAEATATVENGHVTGITVTEPGSGYTTQPVVTIEPPPPAITTTSLWSNDLSSIAGAEPATAIALPVSQGIYSVVLGDKTLPNMNEVGPAVFQNPSSIPSDPQFIASPKDIRLRVWFDDGVHGFQQLAPDQPLNAAPFAFLAGTVQDASITSAKLQEQAVTAGKIAEGAVSGGKIADASISPGKLLSAGAPAAGQLLRFDGTQFEWTTAALSLPFTGSVNLADPAFYLSNNGTGPAILGYSGSGDALSGWVATTGKSGVYGKTTTFGAGQGVYGHAQFSGTGVLGESSFGDGVHGKTAGTGKSGVFGLATGPDSAGVYGASELHHGVYAATGSSTRAAMWAYAPNGAEAIHGHSESNDGTVGYTNGAGKAGVFGWTNRSDGRGGFFSNNNGGEALRTFGRAAIGGNLAVEGNLSVTGTLTLNGGSNFPSIFGQGTSAYVPNMLVCGTYNDVSQFPVGGVTPLFQVGNGSNGAPSNAFSVLNNGDVYARNFFRAGAVGATNYYGEIVYADNDITAGDFSGNGITINSWVTFSATGGPWLPILSDGRFKEIQSNYQPGLDAICGIQPLYFKYKADNPGDIPSQEEHLGVIAQEVQAVLPEAIITRPDGYLTVDLNKINWAAINAIKELKSENDALKARLETENATLRQRLDALEAKLK
jgi:hypothetical protein